MGKKNFFFKKNVETISELNPQKFNFALYINHLNSL